MRVLDLSWSIVLNARERPLHQRAFPLHDEVPPITITKMPTGRYVVEAATKPEPSRLGKSGTWEPVDAREAPKAAHTFSTWDAAMNALSRGSGQVIASSIEGSRAETTDECEGAAA